MLIIQKKKKGKSIVKYFRKIPLYILLRKGDTCG